MDNLILDISPQRKPFAEQVADVQDARVLAIMALNTCEAILRCLDSNGIVYKFDKSIDQFPHPLYIKNPHQKRHNL